MADESEDLYGDIDDSPVFPMATTADRAQSTCATAAVSSSTMTTSKKNASHPRSLVEEVKFLQEQVTKLEKENEILKRNMGILFRTATAELQRKDKEIERLNSQAMT